MKKFMIVVTTLCMLFILTSCMISSDSEVIALQTQYDNFRSNEFTDYDQFVSYINTFSLETAHAAVHIRIEYRQAGSLPLDVEAVGMIISEDTQYYYAVTDATIYDVDITRRQTYVTDVYDQISTGTKVLTNYDLGISLIKFAKPLESLFVLSPATALPMANEPVVLLSYLQGIRNQLTLGTFTYGENIYEFTTTNTLDAGVYGGGVFDVNQNLVGLLIESNGIQMVMYEDIWTLLD